MEQVIEVLFDRFLKEICGEGERRIKLQAFSACLEAIRGIRRLILLLFSFIFLCFLSALSFFAAGYLAVEQWYSSEPNFLDPRLLFSSIVWILSTAFLAFFVREKRWEGAFRLHERIADLERESSTPFVARMASGISEADLARLIDAALDKRLRKDGPPAPSQDQPPAPSKVPSEDHVA